MKSKSQAGFTMVATMLGVTAMASLALVAVTAVRGDIPLYSHDISSKRAYEAAKAGVEDYAFHLYSDPLYWTKCTSVPTPNAVNQPGSTANRRTIPGDAAAEYAIELVPATGHATCQTSAPTESMIETTPGPNTGSFRIRSIGFVEGQRASIVTTFKRPSFLDYVYFTQRETSDPVIYGYEEGSEALKGAYSQCELTYEQGRYNNPIPHGGGEFCTKISFVSGDKVNGPLHTNDTLAVCGSPTFGRTSTDFIEMAGKSPGWFGTCGSNSPIFTGSKVTSAAVLVPPATNSKLKNIASAGYKFTGQVYICLSGETFKVSTTSANCTENFTTKPFPENGVVYVENGTGCSATYSPFTATYPETSTCGNAIVHGTFTGQLTIAAENNIIINGDTCRGSCGTATGTGILGLIANNFIRIYHPYPNETKTSCGSSTGEVRLENLNIDAALLAINHSVIVDHYDCGEALGNLNIEGTIAQKFRGPVGTTGGTGYIKNYVYDDRLRYLEPPNFIEPTGTAWVIGRETEG